jgi:hypothetical protein
MDCCVEEIEPNAWRVRIESITRVVRYRSDSQTFAPWEISSADGHVLWSAASLESAFRWIQARTGYPAEALFAQALLERSAPEPAPPESSDAAVAAGKKHQALGS